MPYSIMLTCWSCIFFAPIHWHIFPVSLQVWPGATVYPDFTHPDVGDWWYESASDFHKEIAFDGLWIVRVMMWHFNLTDIVFLYTIIPLNWFWTINTLWPSNAIWHKSGSTLAQVMACCLTATSHYLNQCWFVRFSVMYLRVISENIHQPLTNEINLKITYLKFLF